MFMYVLFYPGQSSHLPSCFGAGVTNLNNPPSSFLLPRYCGLGAGSIPLRAIVNKKQCETRGLFMSLVIHYWIGGCIRLRNDLYCVGCGVNLCSFTRLQEIGWEDYCHDIFCVAKSFPYKDQIEELCIIMLSQVSFGVL